MRFLVIAASLLFAACGHSMSAPDALSCTGAHAAGSACGEPCEMGNAKGVGAYCTKGGGQCGNNPAPYIFCTIDFDSTADAYCTGACTSDSQCGPGAYCSGSGMGSKGCVPALCGGTPTLDAGT